MWLTASGRFCGGCCADVVVENQGVRLAWHGRRSSVVVDLDVVEQRLVELTANLWRGSEVGLPTVAHSLEREVDRACDFGEVAAEGVQLLFCRGHRPVDPGLL
ncbi:MAG: hypothetical protein QM733_03520 [Ilumatobacteraceae bacterium]